MAQPAPMNESTVCISVRNCPACGSGAGQTRGSSNGYRILSCSRCRTTYVACLPAFDPVQDYDGYYCPDNLRVPGFVSMRLDEIVASFSEHRQNGRLLDVGFGAGSLLQAAARAGWHAHGIEVSQPAVEQGRRSGFEVFHGELAEAEYADGYFDVVTAVEVLEHVGDPGHLMAEIGRVLRPGGLFWATTPHGRGGSGRLLGLRWSIVSPPEHLQLFSTAGIQQVLAAAGFHRIEVATEGINPYEIIHVLKNRATVPDDPRWETFDRVGTGYQLNARLSTGSVGPLVKSMLNQILRVTRLGDSLKIRAVR